MLDLFQSLASATRTRCPAPRVNARAPSACIPCAVHHSSGTASRVCARAPRRFLGVFSAFGVAWPDDLQTFFSFFSVFNVDVDRLHLACALDGALGWRGASASRLRGPSLAFVDLLSPPLTFSHLR